MQGEGKGEDSAKLILPPLGAAGVNSPQGGANQKQDATLVKIENAAMHILMFQFRAFSVFNSLNFGDFCILRNMDFGLLGKS